MCACNDVWGRGRAEASPLILHSSVREEGRGKEKRRKWERRRKTRVKENR